MAYEMHTLKKGCTSASWSAEIKKIVSERSTEVLAFPLGAKIFKNSFAVFS
jgi:hypothetical protein